MKYMITALLFGLTLNASAGTHGGIAISQSSSRISEASYIAIHDALMPVLGNIFRLHPYSEDLFINITIGQALSGDKPGEQVLFHSPGKLTVSSSYDLAVEAYFLNTDTAERSVAHCAAKLNFKDTDPYINLERANAPEATGPISIALSELVGNEFDDWILPLMARKIMADVGTHCVIAQLQHTFPDDEIDAPNKIRTYWDLLTQAISLVLSEGDLEGAFTEAELNLLFEFIDKLEEHQMPEDSLRPKFKL